MSMEQLSLFDSQETYHPLASRVRPEDLEEFAGQEHLLGAAGGGQDHAGGDHCPQDPCQVHQFQRGYQRHQGDQGGYGPGGV